MALTTDTGLEIDYDAEADVLYASLGPPQRALSAEIELDILLRYVPPRRDVVGVTMMNFLEHFPLPRHLPFLDHAVQRVTQILQKYPQVPQRAETP